MGGEIEDSALEVLHTCPLTNLTGERLFRDFDYCLNTKRNASLFHRTTRNMWKHNRTAKFLSRQSQSMTQKLIKKAIRYGPVYKRQSMEAKEAILKKTASKMCGTQKEKR